MEILEKDGNLRLIKKDGKFFIQKRKWFVWRDTYYGTFGKTDKVYGYTEFKTEPAARILYYKTICKL